jgi:hypothetical protein
MEGIKGIIKTLTIGETTEICPKLKISIGRVNIWEAKVIDIMLLN